MADTVKLIILVAGHEYEGWRHGLDFTRMATSRAQEIIDDPTACPVDLKRPVVLRFLRFDFGGGKIQWLDYRLESPPKVVVLKEKSWESLEAFTNSDPADPNKFVTKRPLRPIQQKNDYDVEGFKQTSADAKNVMSIVDVYQAI